MLLNTIKGDYQNKSDLYDTKLSFGNQ